ncbi:altronate dehydratase family protein [soil metagenome]
MNKVIKINPSDDLLVALANLQRGEIGHYNNEDYKLLDDVGIKHKFAVREIKKGEPIKLYGVVIGKALQTIERGQLISTNNIVHDAEPYQVRPSQYKWQPPDVSKWINRTFLGYKRSDGQVGTRNFWLVVPLVFCENRNVEYLKNAFVKKLGYATPDKYEGLVDQLLVKYQSNKPIAFDHPHVFSNASKRVFNNVDGIKFLTHTLGCGGTSEDSSNLCKLIAGYINNPNVAGATILSLGCQKAQVDTLKQAIRTLNPTLDKSVLFFEQQKYQSEELMLKQAILETFTMLSNANKITREVSNIKHLCVGLKCGGSDGFSGITANPAMGHVADILTVLKGKTMLAEFPELCGVEQELIDRSVNTEIAEKFSKLMRDYNSRAEAIGSGFSMNPSPGNIRDGLLTDAMKSAGAAKKGGTSPVKDVLDYTEYIKHDGLNLLCTPGNDVEATTGMAGSGANIIIFSTGLGTPTGNAITPVVKTSTNSMLPQRLNDIIDFDHGDIITEGKTIEQSGEELLELILEIASGTVLTKAEILQQDDFIPWKKGVSL